MGGVVVRHRDVYAAIRRLDVQFLTVPADAGEFDVHAAVGGRAANRAANSSQRDATIQSFEIDPAAHVADRDTAIVRL